MAQVEKLVGLESPLEVGQKINEIIEKGVGAAFKLFDTKITDHELTFEESEGWALQGTYVYKTGVSGTRYGYPTFYAKCIEEKKQAGEGIQYSLDGLTATFYNHPNGHQFYDIADKDVIRFVIPQMHSTLSIITKVRQ